MQRVYPSRTLILICNGIQTQNYIRKGDDLKLEKGFCQKPDSTLAHLAWQSNSQSLGGRFKISNVTDSNQEKQ
jgi:hypothetical protein